jgi:hypothetical protein
MGSDPENRSEARLWRANGFFPVNTTTITVQSGSSLKSVIAWMGLAK